MERGTNSVQWLEYTNDPRSIPSTFLFQAASTPPTQLPIQWAPGIERLGLEVDNLSIYDMALN
jgi:hypothetical protein